MRKVYILYLMASYGFMASYVFYKTYKIHKTYKPHKTYSSSNNIISYLNGVALFYLFTFLPFYL